MVARVLRAGGEFEASRPWVIGAVLLCAVGTLGTVVDSATPRGDAGRAAGFADVLRTNPGLVMAESTTVVAVVTAAGLAALWWSLRRTWPWLLLAGVALTIPAELLWVVSRNVFYGDAAWLIHGTVTSGAQLVLLGTLAAGLRLVHIGAAGAGAILIGAGAGAQIFGAAADVLIARIMILQPGGSQLDFASAAQILLHDGMLLAAIGGALLVAALHLRYDGRPELAAPPSTDPAIGRRATIAGAVAALAFIPAAVMRTGVEFTTSAYILLLVAGLAAAVLAGVRATLGTVAAGAVIVGMSGPASALIQAESDQPIRMWFLTALGVVAGAAAVFPSWRRWSAAAACASSGAALAVTLLIRPDGVTALMLTLLAATATAAIASLGVWLTRDGLTPVVLGPLLFATVIGACGLLAHWQGTGKRGPGGELFRDPAHLWIYTALLLAAAAAFPVLERLKTRPASVAFAR